MLPKSIELEKFRQKIDKLEEEIGSLSDYLDLGKPSEQRKKQAEADIAKLRIENEKLRAEFHDMLVAVRESELQAIEQWVQWHLNVCERIIAEPVHDAHTRTRQYVARETLNQWNKVKRGEQDVVLINWSFLKDYLKTARESFSGFLSRAIQP